jgi:hypothetical protein
MRNKATHFEQVPIEVPESILRLAAELPRVIEKSPAPGSVPRLQPAVGFPEQDEINPATGRL